MSSSTNTNIANLRKEDFNRAGLEDLMKRRFIVGPAFPIYAGVAGLFDYGPVGCAIKANLIAFWRQFFVHAEDMLEVDCTVLTPERVLEASGHVGKFNDYMVKDTKTGNCFRADHLLEAHLEKLLEDPKLDASRVQEYKLARSRAGDMDQQELTVAMKKYNIKAPETGNDLEDPFKFNLMFQISIGPTGLLPGYLRPETAQGIFVNFKRLLEYNGGKLPFAAAQIGNAYRNEIAPRSGLLRVREFTMAEIEHFVKPHDKRHPKFKNVAGVTVNLLTAKNQSSTGDVITMSLGEAVESKTIDNETLGYFVGRIQLFLVAAGVKPEKLRFRQHQQNEMAHYANDCWDAEIFTSYGWVECVGNADRGCYDLTQHSKFSKVSLQYYEEFKDGPKIIKVMKPVINKQLVGKTFKSAQKAVLQYIEGIDFEKAKELQQKLEKDSSVEITADGQNFTLTKDMLSFTEAEEKVSGESITPHVIEPSFGLGRIIYAILEHSYYVREGDEQRGVLSLPAILAPVKVSVLPLTQSETLAPFTARVASLLKEAGLSSKVDETGQSIGRRYARTDEIGVPFGITVDFATPTDSTVTLRERDSTKQVRVPISDVANVLRLLCDNSLSWSDVLGKYPLFVSKE